MLLIFFCETFFWIWITGVNRSSERLKVGMNHDGHSQRMLVILKRRHNIFSGSLISQHRSCHSILHAVPKLSCLGSDFKASQTIFFFASVF